MIGILDNAEIELPCESCGAKTKKSVGWIKANGQFTCSCGAVVHLEASQFVAEIAKLERAFDALKGPFK